MSDKHKGRNTSRLQVTLSNLDFARLVMYKNQLGDDRPMTVFASDVLRYFHYTSLKNSKSAWLKFLKENPRDLSKTEDDDDQTRTI